MTLPGQLGSYSGKDYKFPKNPYYRCMLAWNSLPVDISLLDSKESFTKAVKDTVHNPYIKVL